MQDDIVKLCADSLRSVALTKYGIKLKAAHAHELSAAYFGYKSKNALLAETKYPIDNLRHAEFVVMVPDAFIDQRRKELEGLSSDLPDSYALGEPVYKPLFTEYWWGGIDYPPFRSFKALAKTVVENDDEFPRPFRIKYSLDGPLQYIVEVDSGEDEVVLTVLHSHPTSGEEMLLDGKSIIKLPRVAGHIGFGKPKLSVEMYTGHARKTFRLLETQQ